MNQQEPETKFSRRALSRKALLFLVVGLVLGGTFWKTGVLGMFSSPTSQTRTVDMSVPEDVSLKTSDDSGQTETPDFASMSTTEKIVGTWTFSDSDASRVIVNRADGTATIDVTFGFVASFLYGSQLQLDLEWTFEDDVLTHTIIGGSPEGGKKALIRDYGAKTEYKILKLTAQEMLLKETSGDEDEYLWKRVVDE